MNTEIIAWGIVAIFLSLGGGYFYGHHKGEQDATAQQESQALKDERLINEVDQAIAGGIANLKVNNVTVNKQLEKEIHFVPEYRDCVASDDRVLELVNDTLTGTVGADGKLLPAIEQSNTGNKLH